LSGIRTNATRRSTSGLPGLSEIPILGLLFGSTGKQEEDVEGAVFIVPSVIESVTKRSSELIDRALQEYDDYSGDIDTVGRVRAGRAGVR
ncbi:MAG TPA: hypothetical protein VGI70_21650, partial [Polyangiales bacterium]